MMKAGSSSSGTDRTSMSSCSATMSRCGSRTTAALTISRSSGAMSMSTILVRSNRFPLVALARVSSRAAANAMNRRIRLGSSRGLDLTEFAARPRDVHRFGSVANPQLLEDVVHVVLHRRELDVERACDLLVRQTVADQTHDLALAAGQLRSRLTRLLRRHRCDPAEKCARDRGGAEHLVADRRGHRVEELPQRCVARDEAGHTRLGPRDDVVVGL